MKLISVTLHNYLSHPDTTFELNGTRLAAIVGPNGAGKSALLEALKYVLFDDGRAKTDQLVRLGETDMSAAIEFDFAGCRYRAVRGRTSKGAGKSYLELAVQAVDGSWTSLSGDDIRDTQAKIQALLGVDADTFGTAVFLGQGEANRFAEATAGERKRILGQVLGLEIYAKAEARARDEARTLEAATGFQRSTLERLDETLAARPAAEALVTGAEHTLAGLTADRTAAGTRRVALEASLREMAGELASYDQAATDVKAIEARIAVLGDRYRRTRDRRTASERGMAEAEALTAGSADVAAAAADLPAMRLEGASLEEAETRDRAQSAEINRRRAVFGPLERDLAEKRATWTAGLRYAQARVTELIAGVNALEPVVCRQCGTANVVDQADLHGQLTAARARVAELEGAEPIETTAHSRERAAIKRLEEKHAEDGWDPSPLIEARRQLADLERRAARGEAIAQASATVERERAAIKAADEELAAIDAEGKGARAELSTKTALAAKGDPLRRRRDQAADALRTLDDEIRTLDIDTRAIEGRLGLLRGQLEGLDRRQAERDDLTDRLAEADVALAELRRLVAAFGVTGIPARIIEGVLPELSGYANELLGELRPGMVLEIRAQRAKRDGKGVVEALDLIVRDDVGERPLAVFSGGERMSVSLAIATALSRLVARRAGTAIRTLVIDEPDGLDADARRSFGQALRVLAHHGELERVVLVSHHPDLAEFGDAVYQVTKNGAGSVVELVA